MTSSDRIYKKLRKHLNKMPVGYTRTISGVEIELLKSIFTPETAKAATYMTYQFETVQDIHQRIKKNKISLDALKSNIDKMEGDGAILVTRDGDVKKYALIPYVVGMYEFQTDRMTPEFYRNTLKYFKQGYFIDYLSTSIPQMRVVPIEKSIPTESKIASYDEVNKLIDNTQKPLAVVDCICKKAQGLIGEPCKQSDSDEVCIILNDYSELGIGNGIAREITKEEAKKLVVQAEKDGLVCQTANEQDPQVICACCQCCCGIMGVMKAVPRPGDFAATNYTISFDEESCIGCGVCRKRCNMSVFKINEKKAVLKTERCIGCGLCVPTCKPGSLKLVKKEVEVVPPMHTSDLYETIMKGKKNKLSRVLLVMKSMFGSPRRV